jgi:hypothetical protein
MARLPLGGFLGSAWRAEDARINRTATEEAHAMLSKTRTTIIALALSASFAGAAIVPAASQANLVLDAKPTTSTVTCSGGGNPGDKKTETITHADGTTSTTTKICGNDGKWHTAIDFTSPEGVTPVHTVTPILAAR